jgi:probable rRNA maturation factor
MRVDLQVAKGIDGVPRVAQLRTWVAAAAAGRVPTAEVSIRVVGAAEGRRLNRDFRGKDAPTNVLAFPAELAPELGLPMLGDLVICAEVLAREATLQGKPAEAHWAHLVVHGTLHLLGFDHQTEDEASRMESEEIQILERLGYPDPYMPTAEHGERRDPVGRTGSDDG